MNESADLTASNRLEGTTSGRDGWANSFFRPVDISFLVFFRIAFGATMLWHVWRYYSTKGIEHYFIYPQLHFTYFGFDWVRPWPGIGMNLHYLVMGVCALCIVLGLFYRLSAILFCLGFTYTFLLEKSLYQNHYYLTCLLAFLMIFLPAHRCFSIDVLIRPRLRSDDVPVWMLWLLRAQIGIPYSFGALAKMNSDWLQGQPMRMGLAERTHYPLFGPLFRGDFIDVEWVVYFFAHGGLLFDLLIVPALLWKRTRLAAYLVAVGFHLTNSVIFQIGYFPWFMILATAIYFSPSWPRRLLQLSTESAAISSAVVRPLSFGKKITIAFWGVYLTIQLLVPFRHYLYPGNVSWTEEGHRFAWHMMLRGKTCGLRFYATDPKTGRTWIENPLRYLINRQVEKLGKEPDMLLQFSHFLAEELRRKGIEDVEIRALVLVSLNGRKPQLLIDPNANLASVPRTWRRYPWIMPLVEPLRMKAWDVPLLEWEQDIQMELPTFMQNKGLRR